MEKDKQNGVILAIAGAALIAMGIFADQFGFGQSDGVGYKQMGAIIVGVLVLVAGMRSCKCEKK